MGTNIHAFAHRLTALSMACLASAGFTFCCLSGFGCSFIKIQALDGRSVGNLYGEEFKDSEVAYLGVQCISSDDSPFYALDGSVDRLWDLSRLFLYIGLAFGTATTLFSWLLSSCVRPTAPRWRILSVLAACSAVFQIPIFLVFESDNCNFDVTRQNCELSNGAYLNIVSVSIWIIMTIWVQCLRAPRWDEELDAWKVNKNEHSIESTSPHIGKEIGGETTQQMQSKKIQDRGDDTVEMTEKTFSPHSTREQPWPLPSTYSERPQFQTDDDIEQQRRRNHKIQRSTMDVNRSFDNSIEVTEDAYAVGSPKSTARKMIQQTSPYTGIKHNLTRTSHKKRGNNLDAKKSHAQKPIIDQSKQPNKDDTKRNSPSLIQSLKNRIPRMQISKSSRQSSSEVSQPSVVADFACGSSTPLNEPSVTTTQAYNEIMGVDRLEAMSNAKQSVDRSHVADMTTAVSTKIRTKPGFHISCVYEDGTKQEAHFPSVPNCCIGMGDHIGEEETEFKRFPQIREEFQMIDYDDYDNRDSNHSESADFLVRKLRREEKAAATRQAKRNMAPVASLKFISTNSLSHDDRMMQRTPGDDDDCNDIINDDVSEMTRGSGWASGVSEILDDTDLRHQSRMINPLVVAIAVAVFLLAGPPVASLTGETTPNARPIREVAVIGSGIAGLGVAHALASLTDEDDDMEVSLFDARPGLNSQDGAGIQLNGGLTALGKMNKDLQKKVMEAGLPAKKVESRAKAWKNPSATTYDTLLQLDLESLVKNAGGAVTEGLVQNGELMWYSIMRGALQEVLVDNLPTSSQIQFDKKLTDIIPSEDHTGVVCKFSDNSICGPFDMVVGCDGIKSAVKDYIDTGKVQNGNSGIYSGIRIKFAVRDGDSTSDSNPTTAGLTQYFGDGGYGLSGVYGNGKGKPPTKCAFMVSLDDDYIGPFKRKEKASSETADENVAWSQDARKSIEEGKSIMFNQVQCRDLPDFELGPTIRNADRFFELGVYFHNPFTLKGWSKELPNGSWAVLAGDAAHAMPPFLGQGANQALQDAYTLASKICSYNDIVQGRWTPPPVVDGEDVEEPKSLKVLLKEYEQKRWLPTASITVKSALIGYLETGGVDGFYSKFRDVFFRTMGLIGVAKKVLLDAATPKL